MSIPPEHANSDYTDPVFLQSGTQPGSYCVMQRYAREQMLSKLNVDEYEFIMINNKWFIIPKGNSNIWEKASKSALMSYINQLMEFIENI